MSNKENYLIIDYGMSNMRRIIFVLFLTFTSIFSQDPNWSSFITFPQYPSPYFTDWERNPNIGTLTLNYTGTAPVEFYFEVIINIDGYGEAIRGRTANREYTFGPMSEVLTFNDISDWESTEYNKDLEAIIIQSGKLPESTYSICVSTFATDGTLLTDACTDFDIALPNPPQLISPENEGSIDIAQPTFMWNPVSTPPEVLVHYQLKIVEILQGQTAYRALESNVPVVEAEIPSENLYIYRLDDYPLDQNHSYAWQVQATDDEGVPVATNEGYSEIYEFTYGNPQGTIALDTLVLIEDYAYLFDIQQLNITDNNSFINFDGSCSMLIKGSDGVDKYIDVFAQNLMMQKDTEDDPVFLGGSVTGTIYDEVFGKEVTGEFFQPREIEFIAPNQFTIGGNFYLGEEVDIPLNGRLTLNDDEFIGDLNLIGDPANPVFELGDDSFKLNISSISLTYPTIEANLQGSLSMFGNPSPCTVDEIELNKKGDFSATVNCEVSQEISLLQGSNLFIMNINSVNGKISGNILNNKVDYSILVDGGVNFNVNPNNSFGANVVYELKPNKFKLISFDPNASVDASNIDFGWVKWNMKNIKLNNLAYENSNWDFDLAMDIDLSFPDFSDTKLPSISGISFTPRGFKFPEVSFKNFSIPKIDFKAFELELYGLSSKAFTFDLRNYSPGSIAQMAFDWKVKFNMPNLPNGTNDGFKFPNWDLKANITDGNLNLDLPKLSFPSGYDIALPGGSLFNVTSLNGKLSTIFDGSLMSFLPDVNIGGKITLPEALKCDGQEASFELKSMIKLNGNGSISGIIEDVVPKCPINIGLASLYMKKSKVEFKDDDGQKLYLEGQAGIKFTDDQNQSEVGNIFVRYEVLNNEIIKVEGEINEKFTWGLAGENPTFSFELEEASLADGELILDGRASVVFNKGNKLGATFDKFKINLNDYSITDGRIIFDDRFAMVVEDLNNEINFKAVEIGDIPITDTYLYFEMPEKISVDKNGFSIEGKSLAKVKYEGKEFKDLSAVFSKDFTFSLNPFKVATGKCELFIKEEKVAYFNANGFFPDPNYFLNRVIPDKIPLPTLEIAYLQIKENDQLLVEVRTEGNSTRFTTRDGEPIDLVFPSLQYNLAEAPKIMVNFDVAFDDATGEITDGFIRGVIPEESIPTFDLTRVGIPYTIYSVYYGNIDGINKFRLTGKAKLFETEMACQDSLNLTISQTGVLEGSIACDIDQVVSLIPDSDKLNLHINNVDGEFNVNLLDVARSFDFDIQLDSDLRFNMNENESWGVWTLLGLDDNGLRLIDHRMDDVAIPKINLDQFKIGFENFTLGRLNYLSQPDDNGNTGWDFEFGMDLDIDFPELGLKIPNIPNVTLDLDGFHTMDRISIPSFPDSLGFEFQGIQLKPLAFRMPRLNFNWFDPLGGGDGSSWDFDIDFEINFPNMDGASGEMRYPRLTMLNAGFVNGLIVGNIDWLDFDGIDGLNLNFGDGFGFSVRGISGRLFDDNGSQGIGFDFKGHLNLPEYMRCDGEETSVDLTETVFSISSGGYIAGVVDNFVPRCPIDLGFGHFVVTSSSINFSVSDTGQVAILDMTGDLVVDTGDDNTVTANGMLQMDLLTGEIIDGSITIEEQFVWAIPNDKPVLRFTINRAVLDMDGLTIDGDGDLLLPGGQTRRANFNNFKFDYRKYKVKSGSLEIDADFAIKFALEDGQVVWTTIPADTPLTENRTAKLGFTSNLILDANGLSTSGEAVAAIRWDDDPAHQFGNLKIRYTNDFKFSLRPFKVSEGRADLIHTVEGDETIIATLTHDGLNLGDIFGLIPIPEIIPLPNRDIAYLRIKSGDQVLVESETTDDGNLRIVSTEERPAALVIPSLKMEGQPVDSMDAHFNIEINPTTGQIVEGEITLVKGDSLSIINLRNRGIPADVFKIFYGEIEGNYQLTADVQVDLPNVLNGMPIKLRKVRFDNNGLSGNLNLGTYSEVYPVDEIETLGLTNIGTQALITLEGVDVEFGENNSVGFSGKFIPLAFANGDDTTDVQYSANWNQEEGKFAFTFDFADGETFNFGVGTFTPLTVNENPAMELSFTEEDFELLINGEFESEQLGDFSLAIENLRITKDNISVDNIQKPSSNPIRFKLFEADFRIFGNPAISFTFRDNVLKMTMSGDITLFEKTDRRVTFNDFTIGTDGTFSIGEAGFLNTDWVLVENYIALNDIAIRDNKLAIGGWIKLPEPVSIEGEDTQFDFGFNIDANGNITADQRIGNKIVLIDEPREIGNGDQSEYDFWKAKFDLTYLALELNFADILESEVQMISDIYWDNDRNKRVSLGEKEDNNYGLTIDFAGNIVWGSAEVNGEFVDFDEDMFKIKMTSVQLSGDDNNNLNFGLGGEFALNFDAIEGGLSLADFTFNKTEIVSIGRITGGTLTIEDVGSLTLNNIGYSDSRTQLWVKGGEMPGAEGGDPDADSTQITVNNYLSFGGEITIDGFGAAGVDRFLSYNTDEGYTLLIDNAHFEVDGYMDASLDLLYYSGDAGFLMKAGGRATIKDFDVVVVGKIAKIDNEVSWGFFIATDIRIDITPVVITGVGGGFFYNPTADDILAVKRLADVGSSSGKIAVQDASFAIFLFGQAAIIDDVIIYGRTLITVTDRQFMLDGKVIIFDMENKLEGEIHLMVQWAPTFEAEGEITLDVDVAKIAKGNGKMGFYVYSSDQWAIYGESTIKLFNYLETSSDFFVGNTGFMVGMSASVDFDIWIIEVGAGIEVKVWYLEGKSWGAYAKAWVKAEMLWGVAKAKGWLQCALIGSQGNAYLYGQAGLEIHVLWTDWSGSAWAKIANGELSGGRGSDSDMDALIAEAAGQSAAAEAEMDAMKESIESRPPTVQSFSEEELLRIYDALAELGRKAKYGTPAEKAEADEFFRGMREMEYRASTYIPAEYRSNYESTALPWIQTHIYKGYQAPNLESYSNNRQSVDSIVAVFNEAISDVLPLLSVDFESVESINNNVAEVNAVDPTIGTTFAEYTIDENGNYEISSYPSMNLDEDIANQNQSNLRTAEVEAAQYKQKVAQQLFRINSNIEIIENSLVGDDEESGLEGAAKEYGYLISRVSNAYRVEYKFARETELWARSKLNQFNTEHALTTLERQMGAKANNLYSNAEWYILMDLARSRVFKMNILLGSSQAEAFGLDADERVAWSEQHDKMLNGTISENEYRSWAISRNAELGKQLWYDTPHAGLNAAISSSQNKIRDINSNKNDNLYNLGQSHVNFTNKLNNLYYSLMDLSETKYDILNQLISWEERDADPNKPQRDLNYLREMKNELTAKMEVPTISNFEALNLDKGIYSHVLVRWNTSGPNSSKHKYLIDYSSNNPTIRSNGYLAVGNKGSLTLFYTPQPNQTRFGATQFKLKARNQVGYTIHRTLNFTPTFTNRTVETFGDITYSEPETDNTPPYMSEFLGMSYLWRVLEDDPTKMMLFVSDSSTIEANWTGRDTQTGIQEYKYQFVQVSNPEANSPYQYPVVNNANLAVDMNLNVGGMQLPGLGGNNDEEDEYADWVTNLGRDNVVLNNLEMEHGRVYQLKVVAKNGEGLYSETIGGRKQFVFADLTPPSEPSFPFVAYGYGGPVYRGGMSYGVVSYPVTPLVDYNDLHNNGANKYINDFDDSDAEKTISWLAAEDPESNILRYEIQVSSKLDESIASNWINVGRNLERTLNNSVPALNEMLNYRDTFKVAVRAVNRAKRTGKSAEKYFTIEDLTPPTRPTVVGTYTANTNRAVLAFSLHSRDRQSGVSHYEVAIGSRPNGTMDYVSWDNAITIPMNSISYNGRSSITIPNNTESYIAVRGVNRAGLKSPITYTGPFYQDDSRPLTPTVSADVFNITGRGKTLALSFSNVNDPESGIEHVQYRLEKKVGGSNTWQSVIYWRAAESKSGVGIQLDNYNIGNNTDLRIRVRSRNTVGLLSAPTTLEYRLPDVTPPVTPTVSVNSGALNKSERGVQIVFGSIQDPQSGIRRIEYKLESVSSSSSFRGRSRISTSYSILQNWSSNSNRTSKAFLYSDYNLNSGDVIRVSVRTVNRDGLVSNVRRETHELN